MSLYYILIHLSLAFTKLFGWLITASMFDFDFIVTSLVLFVAFLGDSIFGFGAGLISLPLLLQIHPVKTSVTLLLCFQAFTAVLAFKARKDIDWPVIKLAVPSLIVGVLLGLYGLSSLDDSVLRGILAVLIVVYLLKEIKFSSVKLGERNPRLLSIFGGFLGGLLQGSMGVGGPGFLIYLNELGLSKKSFRATILGLFFVCNCFRAVTSYSAGLFTPTVLKLFTWTAPIVVLAMFIGYKLHVSVSETIYQKAIYLILSVSAISLCHQFIQSM